MGLINLHTAKDFSLRLAEEHRAWTIKRDTKSCKDLIDTYDALLIKLSAKPSADLKNEAIKFFTPVCEAAMIGDVSLPHQTLKILLIFLTGKDVLDRIKQNPFSEKPLAWFTCNIAALYAFPKRNYSRNDLEWQKQMVDIVNHWTGRPLYFRDIARLDDLVIHLYGKQCWDLIACETKEKFGEDTVEKMKVRYDTVKTLMAMNLPISLGSDAPKKSHIPSALPSDFST